MSSKGFYDRLISLKAKDETLEHFAKRLHIGKRILYYYREDERSPTLRTIRELSERLGVNPVWLAYGEGEKNKVKKSEHGAGMC